MAQIDKIDFEFIAKHCDQNNYEIPCSFDKITWKVGETYKIRIGNIYDPSKFWIVHHEKELSLFHRFINDFYNLRSEDYRMPKEVIKRNRYCAAFSDGAYYRGLIVNVPRFRSLEKEAVVFLFDFGVTAVVKIDNLFYLYEKLYKVHRFAIRACLNGIEPIDSDTWTKKAVGKFNELTIGKVLLCILECRDSQLKVVHIRIGEVATLNQVIYIGEILMEEKLAKVSSGRKHRLNKSKGKVILGIRYPFLFPSHQALENGFMPSTHWVAEMIKQCPYSASKLYKPYNCSFNMNNLS